MDKRLELRADGDLLTKIDIWRGKRLPIPSRAEVVRMAVEKLVDGDPVDTEEQEAADV